MATDNSTAYQGKICRETELIVEIHPRNYVEYKGTLAQLRAEGLIPSNFRIPNRNIDMHWRLNGFEFNIHRCRPAWLKGPKALWLNVDYWSLRLEPFLGNVGYNQEKLYELQCEMELVKNATTLSGRILTTQHAEAKLDDTFQDFMELAIGSHQYKRWI